MNDKTQTTHVDREAPEVHPSRRAPRGIRTAIRVYMTQVEPGVDASLELSGARNSPDFSDAEANARRERVCIEEIARMSDTKPEEWRMMTDEEITAYIQADRLGRTRFDDEDDGMGDDD